MSMSSGGLVTSAVLAVVVTAASGCSGAEGDMNAPATVATSVTTSAPTGDEVTPPSLPAAECSVGAMESAVTAELDPEGAIPGTVTISDCRDLYARVFYVPDSSNLESEQVFLRDHQGVWRVLAYGTGIDCASDTDLAPPELADACVALGLRD